MVSVTKARTLLVDAVILFVSSFRKIPSANDANRQTAGAIDASGAGSEW